MADPISIGAAIGWGVTAVGWLASPIIPRLLNRGFALLEFNASEKLKILDIQVLQLQRVMEVVDESTYRVRLEPLLEKLKSAFYEAEDILDRVEYQSLKKQIQDAKLSGSKMDLLKKNLRSSMPSSPLKDEESGMSKSQLAKSLNKIESAVSDACKVLEQLNLPGVSNDNGRRVVSTSSCSAAITVGPLRVIGRDQDRDKIIAMLHANEHQCQVNTVSGTCYSVIGIHGIAGSGKSTLARCVYDHENMEDHFNIVMWIHVSQKFSLDSIFREMFEGATGEECPKFSSLNVLKESLEKKLRGKRILLVLDDVWYNNRNSEDREELQKLISPLHVGKEGSRILVTSRTEAALVTLGAVKERCIPISDLDDELFLEMFMHYALQGARVSDNDRRILEMIGEDIAKKLKRSPLAARTVGSRLRETQTVEFWRSVKDRDLLNDTMGALWWSYQYLDEQVRRCFSYCSIFPRRHRLKRDELVKLWVAEGFIKTSKPEEEMEDVAKDYFDELFSASFLQLGGEETSYDIIRGLHYVDYFTIHDLLCDLAEEVAGRDYFRIEKGSTEEGPQEGPQDVRYLFVRAYYSEMLIEKISGLKNLRTLIIYPTISVNLTKWKVFESVFNMLGGLRKLRVLKLGFSGRDLSNRLIRIPDSIGRLKHLRCFCLETVTLLRIIVPSNFTKLYHMQVVEFRGCHSLAFSGDMTNLVNLRRVILRSALDFPGVGRLTCLQMLSNFTIRKEQGYEPHQLKHLNKLQDRLQIRGLENVQSKEEALEVNLAGKEKLTEVVLEWNSGNCGPEDHDDVLEGLCPSKYLERLGIWGYHGMTFPNWMMGEHNGGPKNLQQLTFGGWSQQGLAPDLGPFIHLHSLYIIRCSWDALPGMEHLKSLKILNISSCKHMQSLGPLPKSLEKFTVVNCNPKFKRLCNDYWAESRKDC
ncbi:putative disease resistance RPP13-like protein 1 [Lolium perenne]|uniref:putative disease resistance RPP13-like protein 1 n=1 Tax=Lolium perenne TaxID=4522 RepID=UPI003A98D27B